MRACLALTSCRISASEVSNFFNCSMLVEDIPAFTSGRKSAKRLCPQPLEKAKVQAMIVARHDRFVGPLRTGASREGKFR